MNATTLTAVAEELFNVRADVDVTVRIAPAEALTIVVKTCIFLVEAVVWFTSN